MSSECTLFHCGAIESAVLSIAADIVYFSLTAYVFFQDVKR